MIDLVLVGMVVGAGVLGWRRGLAISLLAGGAFVVAGLPFAALAAAAGRPAPAVAYLFGGMLGLVPIALRLHHLTTWLESVIADERLRVADRAAGVLVNVAIAMCLAWFVGAIASIAPGDSSELAAVRSSSMISSLVDAVPPQGGLGVLVLRSGLAPSVNGPLVLAEDPDPASALLPAVLAASGRVLQVRGTACHSIVSGTGWVAGPGIVVTNAHVVAGTPKSFLSGGPQFEGAPATVTAFDEVNDIAVLVLDPGPGHLPAPLPIIPRVQHGERAAVIGYPHGGQLQIVAARIDRVSDYDVKPLTGGASKVAPVLAFRADVEPGNSGGPVLAEDGSVLGLVVSKGIGQRVDAAYGVASAQLLAAITAGARRVPVSTGRCLTRAELGQDSDPSEVGPPTSPPPPSIR